MIVPFHNYLEAVSFVCILFLISVSLLKYLVKVQLPLVFVCIQEQSSLGGNVRFKDFTMT